MKLGMRADIDPDALDAAPAIIAELSENHRIGARPDRIGIVTQSGNHNVDPCCLDFHAHGRTVQTPSRWQVRRPIYAASVGHWRNYAEHLPALVRAFRDARLTDVVANQRELGEPTERLTAVQKACATWNA